MTQISFFLIFISKASSPFDLQFYFRILRNFQNTTIAEFVWYGKRYTVRMMMLDSY